MPGSVNSLLAAFVAVLGLAVAGLVFLSIHEYTARKTAQEAATAECNALRASDAATESHTAAVTLSAALERQRADFESRMAIYEAQEASYHRSIDTLNTKYRAAQTALEKAHASNPDRSHQPIPSDVSDGMRVILSGNSPPN